MRSWFEFLLVNKRTVNPLSEVKTYSWLLSVSKCFFFLPLDMKVIKLAMKCLLIERNGYKFFCNRFFVVFQGL